VLASCAHAADPRRARLRITNLADDPRDRITAYISRTTSAPALGDPVNATDYTICLFHRPTPIVPYVPIFSARAVHGGLCDGRPCWKSTRRGARYVAADATPDGLVQLSLLGSHGSAGAKVKGRGTLLSGRTTGLPAVPVPLPLKLQIQGANGACFEADFTTAARNDLASGRFAADAAP
jgi:hypothetical protein